MSTQEEIPSLSEKVGDISRMLRPMFINGVLTTELVRIGAQGANNLWLALARGAIQK